MMPHLGSIWFALRASNQDFLRRGGLWIDAKVLQWLSQISKMHANARKIKLVVSTCSEKSKHQLEDDVVVSRRSYM